MKFKDFTQEAYEDIQSYMGGEEQWEEINKTYGVVETKGIFQYDYESQLRNAATQYQRQNEEASNSVRRMFDNVNGHIGTETRSKLLREAAVRNIGQWARA